MTLSLYNIYLMVYTMTQIDNFLEELVAATIGKSREIYSKCKYSVSKIVEAMHAPFDKEGVANRTFSKYFNDPNSKYYHMSVQEIIDSWNAKAELGRNNGKALDTYIGMILENHESEEILEKYKSSLNEIAANKCNVFDKFYNDNIANKLEYVTREQMLHDESKGVVGRFDAMFLKNDANLPGVQNLLLIDWKNTEKIETSNSYNKLKGPLYKYDDCELNRYTIQLYIYVYILRKVYRLTDVRIIPLLVQIGTVEYAIYAPQIPYSDELVCDIISFAINEINIQTNKN